MSFADERDDEDDTPPRATTHLTVVRLTSAERARLRDLCSPAFDGARDPVTRALTRKLLDASSSRSV